MKDFISVRLKYLFILVLLLLPHSCLCNKDEEGISTTQLNHNRKAIIQPCDGEKLTEVLDRTFIAPIYSPRAKKTYCVKLELFQNGTFVADKRSGDMQDCTNAKFTNIRVEKLSDRISYDLTNKEFTLKAHSDGGKFAFNGVVKVVEDTSKTRIKMKAPNQRFPSENFEIELVLPTCIAPSPTPSIYTSNQPSLFISETPSHLLSQNPSGNPSNSPSTIPSELPSQSPSEQLSMVPSSAPSLPRCKINEILGKTYEAPIYVNWAQFNPRNFCFRLELVYNGVFEADTSAATDCAAARFKKNEKAQFSVVGTNIGRSSKITMNAKGGEYKSDGIIEIVEDSSVSEVEFRVIRPITDSKDYEIQLVLPDCTSPSVAPSPSPSLLPSQYPSLHPSKLPSQTPSLFPSVTPSVSPSSLPTFAPSIPICLVEDLLGNTYTASMFVKGRGTYCFRLELINNGSFDVDIQSKGQTNCSEAAFRSITRYSRVKSIDGGTIKLRDVAGGTAGFRGTIVVRDDASITGDVEMILRSANFGNNYEIDLLLPSCIAPSTIPSSTPSMSPSVRPKDCTWDQYNGRALYFVRESEPNHCYKVEMYVGGDFAVDTENPGCENRVFYETRILSVYKSVSKRNKVVRFAPTEYRGFLTGTFKIRSNASLEDGEMEVDGEVDGISKTFSFTLTYPECPVYDL